MNAVTSDDPGAADLLAGRRVPGNRGGGGVRRVLAWIVSPTFSSGKVSRTRLDPSVIQ
jgi:hypothetical protein